MNDFVIMPDATCDLNPEMQRIYDLNVLSGHYTLPDGTEKTSTLNWTEDFTAEKFYQALKKNPNGYKTSPPNIMECFTAFEKAVLENKGVLAMAISTGISGTYSIMVKAKEMVLEKYPNAEIYCFDSLRFGPGFGLMAIYASIMRKEGKTLLETYNFLEENKNRFHQTGWLDDLSFVAKKGRINHAKAFMGTLIGVKPIGEFDHNGLTTVICKAKGEKNAYDIFLKYIEKTIENPSEQIIIIANSLRRKQAEYYKTLIEEKFKPKEVIISDVYEISGINVGPGLMAAYYIGKPISNDLVEEKILIDKIFKGEI